MGELMLNQGQRKAKLLIKQRPRRRPESVDALLCFGYPDRAHRNRESVLGYWPSVVSHPWKAEGLEARVGAQLAENLNGLRGERHDVRYACFANGVFPPRFGPVECHVVPPRCPQFTRSHKNERCHFERGHDSWRSFVGVQHPQEASDVRWLGQGGHVLDRRFDQESFRCRGRVLFIAARRDAVVEDLSADRQDAMRSLELLFLLDGLQHRHKVRAANRRYRFRAECLEDVTIEAHPVHAAGTF